RRPIAMPAPTCTRSTRNARVQAHLLLFATTALVLMAALSSAALAQPAVTVIPKSGPPTDRVTVSGTGFGADEAVDIYFDTTDLALAATNPSGSFTGIRLTIPPSAVPGAHWITGVGRTSGLAAQTTFIVQTDWSQFRRGPQHHGYNPTENILNVSNVGDMQVRWTATTRGAVESSPAVANGVVYVGSGDDKVYAFNTATGQLIWSAAIGAPAAEVASSPAVANGVVYVGAGDGKLYAFNAATGQPTWSAATGQPIYSSPAVANGVVYVGSGNKLYALNAATGQSIWSAPTNGYSVASSPAVANGVVYVGSGDDKLYAFNAATGRLVWSAATSNYLWSSPAVANGVVYVGSDDDKLHAFDAATGEPLWSAATGSSVASSPAVANGVVYVGSVDGSLRSE